MSTKPESPLFSFDTATGTFRLAPVRQVIGGVVQLPSIGIEEMVNRKHDLEHQLGLCVTMMAEGTILPFPFERSVILLERAKRFEEALAVCRYVAEYSRRAEEAWDGWSAMIWKSPSLERCIAKIPKLETRSHRATSGSKA